MPIPFGAKQFSSAHPGVTLATLIELEYGQSRVRIPQPNLQPAFAILMTTNLDGNDCTKS